MTKKIDAEHAPLAMRVIEPSQRQLAPNERFNEGANLTRWGERTDAAPTAKGFKDALQTATLQSPVFTCQTVAPFEFSLFFLIWIRPLEKVSQYKLKFL